jgi:hypothetical protein
VGIAVFQSRQSRQPGKTPHQSHIGPSQKAKQKTYSHFERINNHCSRHGNHVPRRQHRHDLHSQAQIWTQRTTLAYNKRTCGLTRNVTKFAHTTRTHGLPRNVTQTPKIHHEHAQNSRTARTILEKKSGRKPNRTEQNRTE